MPDGLIHRIVYPQRATRASRAVLLCAYPSATNAASSFDSCSPERLSASHTEIVPALHLRLTHHFGAIGHTSALGNVLANLSDPFLDAPWADGGEHTGVRISEADTGQQGSSAEASPLVPAWLAALEKSLSTQPTHPSTPRHPWLTSWTTWPTASQRVSSRARRTAALWC